jgi:hypothetical protein
VEYSESQVYSIPASQADFAAGSMAVPDARYASVDAMLTALNASGPKAVFEAFGGSERGKPIRAFVGATLAADEDQSGEESAYLVTATYLNGVAGILVEKIYDAVHTAGGVLAVGGRADHVDVKLITLTSTGLLGIRTGIDPEVNGAVPASIEIRDVGECLGILRIFAIEGGATGIAPLRRRWR